MILIALGSNLGDRAANLARARALMAEAGICIITPSSIIETPALLMPNSPPEWNIAYFNQVLQVETSLSPENLLIELKNIETALGRADRGHWAPREIDLDILAYDAVLVNTPALILPHPHMHTRDFVLTPLAEIAPHWRHPVLGKTAAEMMMVC